MNLIFLGSWVSTKIFFCCLWVITKFHNSYCCIENSAPKPCINDDKQLQDCSFHLCQSFESLQYFIVLIFMLLCCFAHTHTHKCTHTHKYTHTHTHIHIQWVRRNERCGAKGMWRNSCCCREKKRYVQYTATQVYSMFVFFYFYAYYVVHFFLLMDVCVFIIIIIDF